MNPRYARQTALILDSTNIRVRLDHKSTSVSLLVVLSVCRDGQQVLLAVKNMGGESEAAWRQMLDDMSKRGLRKPTIQARSYTRGSW
jgi:putative transposase